MLPNEAGDATRKERGGREEREVGERQRERGEDGEIGRG
jgi:hypothetical protein